MFLDNNQTVTGEKTFNAHVRIQHGKYLYGKAADTAAIRLIGVDAVDNVVIGQNTRQIELHSINTPVWRNAVQTIPLATENFVNANAVLLSGTQSITGTKTFQNAATFVNGLQVNGTIGFYATVGSNLISSALGASEPGPDWQFRTANARSAGHIFQVKNTSLVLFSLTSGGVGNILGSFSAGGVIVCGDGTIANPGFAFSSEVSTGLFWKSAGVIGFSTSGVQTMLVGSSAIDLLRQTCLQNGVPIRGYKTGNTVLHNLLYISTGDQIILGESSGLPVQIQGSLINLNSTTVAINGFPVATQAWVNTNAVTLGTQQTFTAIKYFAATASPSLQQGAALQGETTPSFYVPFAYISGTPYTTVLGNTQIPMELRVTNADTAPPTVRDDTNIRTMATREWVGAAPVWTVCGTVAAGWTVTQQPQVWKSPTGEVRMKGRLTVSGTPTTSILPAGGIPAGFRPLFNMNLAAGTQGGTGGNTVGLLFNPDGSLALSGVALTAGVAVDLNVTWIVQNN
jgi:hypothetical protein